MSIEISYIKNKYNFYYKLFTIIPWIIIIFLLMTLLVWYMLFLFYFKDENIVSLILFTSFIILFYYVWWIIRWIEFCIFIVFSYFKVKENEKINFDKIINNETISTHIEKNYKKELLWKDILPNQVYHLFIVPTYKEEYFILKDTFEWLLNSKFDHSKILILLAWEEWDKERFLKNKDKLFDEFKEKFWYLSFSVHPKWVFWEMPWKWANIKYSLKKNYKQILEKIKTTPDKVVVTTLDADSIVDRDYLNILTYNYIISEDRKFKSFQPLIFFFNNFWESPFFWKLVWLWNSFFLLFNSVKSFWLRNFSTHAQPLDALIELDFWSSETIVEDWHQYWRSFFWFNWNYECVPIFTKIYQDSNLNKDFFSTANAQYNQMRRWAHWIEDIPYVFCQYLDKYKNINFFRFLYEFWRLFEWIILWWTMHLVLIAWMILTYIKDINITTYITLWWTISTFAKVSIIVLIITYFFSIVFIPWNKLESNNNKIYEFIKISLIYPFTIWVVLLLFTWIPALHTHLAITFWRPMKKFNVTEKFRK